MKALVLSAMVLTAFIQPRDDGGRFTNLDGSRPHGLLTTLRWGVWDRITGKRRRTPPRARSSCTACRRTAAKRSPTK